MSGTAASLKVPVLALVMTVPDRTGNLVGSAMVEDYVCCMFLLQKVNVRPKCQLYLPKPMRDCAMAMLASLKVPGRISRHWEKKKAVSRAYADSGGETGCQWRRCCRGAKQHAHTHALNTPAMILSGRQ